MFKYKVIELESTKEEDQLNDLGANGWQLVSMHHNRAVLMQEVTAKPGAAAPPKLTLGGFPGLSGVKGTS